MECVTDVQGGTKGGVRMLSGERYDVTTNLTTKNWKYIVYTTFLIHVTKLRITGDESFNSFFKRLIHFGT